MADYAGTRGSAQFRARRARVDAGVQRRPGRHGGRGSSATPDHYVARDRRHERGGHHPRRQTTHCFASTSAPSIADIVRTSSTRSPGSSRPKPMRPARRDPPRSPPPCTTHSSVTTRPGRQASPSITRAVQYRSCARDGRAHLDERGLRIVRHRMGEVPSVFWYVGGTDPDKPSAGRHQHKHSTRCCVDHVISHPIRARHPPHAGNRCPSHDRRSARRDDDLTAGLAGRHPAQRRPGRGVP
jgi:hypothetical protein